jgi:RNA polymerase sigma-70 factor, ECF subfamily
MRPIIRRRPSRTVVALSEFEGFKNREIAEILGISLDVVKIRLHRARRELKQRLEAGCDFDRTEANTLACDRKASRSRSVS